MECKEGAITSSNQAGVLQESRKMSTLGQRDEILARSSKLRRAYGELIFLGYDQERFFCQDLVLFERRGGEMNRCNYAKTDYRCVRGYDLQNQ